MATRWHPKSFARNIDAVGQRIECLSSGNGGISRHSMHCFAASVITFLLRGSEAYQKHGNWFERIMDTELPLGIRAWQDPA